MDDHAENEAELEIANHDIQVQNTGPASPENRLKFPSDYASPFQYSILSTLQSGDVGDQTDKSSPTEASPQLLVTKTPKTKTKGGEREIIIGTDPRSLPSTQFLDPTLAQTYKCCICSIDNLASRIPFTPLKTKFCHHFYCPLCIENWRSAELVNSGSCPVATCRKKFEDVDLHAPSGLIKDIHGSLSVHCSFIQNGCDKIVPLSDYSDHVASCNRSRRRGHPPKRLIGTLGRSD